MSTTHYSQRMLDKFMQLCPPEWASQHVHAMTLGYLARIHADRISNGAGAVHALSSAVAAHLNGDGARMLFSGEGDLRAYALFAALTPAQEDAHLLQPGGFHASMSSDPTHPVWITDFGSGYGIERRTLRTLARLAPSRVKHVRYLRQAAGRTQVKEMEITALARHSHHPAHDDNGDTRRDKRMDVSHAILDITNIAALFNDDTVAPDTLFNGIVFNRNLGDLFLLLSPRSAHEPERYHESVNALLRKARIRQYFIYRESHDGPALAGFTWSWISERSLQRIAHHPQRPLSKYEVNDGNILLLEAASTANTMPLPIINALRDGPFKGVNEMYFRSNNTLKQVSMADSDALREAWCATSVVPGAAA